MSVFVCFMSVILCGRNYLLYEYSHKALVIRNTSTKNANLLCILLVLHNNPLPTREYYEYTTKNKEIFDDDEKLNNMEYQSIKIQVKSQNK